MSSTWMSENWIAASWDRLSRGRHILLGIERWIFRERSAYQDVAIARVPEFGAGLFLDGVVQFLERDEFVYHEHFALPPLLFHDNPGRVLIAGGGDGLSLREVLRDPRVEEVVMVEIDPVVVEACRQHLPQLHRGSFDDGRALIENQDILQYLAGEVGRFDVVLVDLVDAYDPAAWQLYYELIPRIRGALSSGAVLGLFADLTYSPVASIFSTLRRSFSCVEAHTANVETFGNEYAFLLASDSVEFAQCDHASVYRRGAQLFGELQSLVPQRFPSAFLLSPYQRSRLENEHGVRLEPLGPDTQDRETISWLFGPADDSTGRVD